MRNPFAYLNPVFIGISSLSPHSFTQDFSTSSASFPRPFLKPVWNMGPYLCRATYICIYLCLWKALNHWFSNLAARCQHLQKQPWLVPRVSGFISIARFHSSPGASKQQQSLRITDLNYRGRKGGPRSCSVTNTKN